jgi:hypothetical protein
MTGTSLGGPAPVYSPFLPVDAGLLAWTSDPWLAQNSSVLTAGSVYISKLPIRVPTLISNLWLGLAVTGVGVSTGSFVGLYSPAGILLAQDPTDQDAAFTGAIGALEFPLSAPQNIQGGPESQWPWVAVLANLATTQPALVRGQGSTLWPELGQTPATYRFGIAATGVTALPASFTPSAIQGTGGANIWAGGN